MPRLRPLLACAALAAGCAAAAPVPAARPQLQAALSERQLVEIATALERRGDTLRAGQYLSLALERGADATRLVPRLLRLHVRGGQYRLARDLAENHLRRHPRDQHTRFFLGALYMGLGMSTNAVEQYERLLKADPARAEAHFALASVLRDQGQDLGRADAHYRAYLRLRPSGVHAEEARAALLTELP